MKKISLVLLLLVLVSGLIFVGCAQSTPGPGPSSAPAPAQSSATSAVAPTPIALSWVSLTPKSQKFTQNVQTGFIDRVNAAAKGQLVISYRGGPEAIPPQDQAKAALSGVVDIIAIPGSYYDSIVPGVQGICYTQGVTTDDERQPGGAYDYLVQLHEKAGLRYLGRGGSSTIDYFYTWLGKKVETPADFKGLMIGGTALSSAPVAAWGATYVSVLMGDYYTALDSHLVDGIATAPLTNAVGVGLPSVAKYLINQPYYKSSTLITMNLAAWNRLSPSLQKIMTDAAIGNEHDENTWDMADRDAALTQVAKAGCQILQLSPDVAKWYVNAAFTAGWDTEIKRFGDTSLKLKQLLWKP